MPIEVVDTTPPEALPAAPGPRRRWLLVAAAVAAVGCLVVTGVGGWLYTSNDLPPIPVLPSTTRVQYRDGATFATLASENRVLAESVPMSLAQAVVAAEDPDFVTSGGNPLTVTGRALRRVFSAGDETLTERYARAALKTRGRARTTVVAAKLERAMSKDAILTAYLNTVYFGRGSSGVVTAADAYFGKPLARLSVEESALLVALIEDPVRFDPSVDLRAAEDRWNGVLDAMVRTGALDRAKRANLVFPSVLAQAPDRQSWRQGSTGVLGGRIEHELNRLGFSDELIRGGGLTVTTTIDPDRQQTAAKTAKTGPDLSSALVSIDPATGAVRAYYGGERGYGNADLASTAAAHPAAATAQPFVLAAGVRDGYGIDSLWNGTTGQVFADRRTPLHNSGRSSACGPRCSLAAATVGSVETVFWALTSTLGAPRVADTLAKAGIPKPGDTPALGRYRVSVLDQAAAYATLAANGTYRRPYFVDKVTDRDGTVLYDHAGHASAPARAWDDAVGRDVSAVLQQASAAEPGLRLGRPAAVKAGGQQYRDISDTWVAGYTPQLATAVWTGTGDSTTIPAADRADGLIDVPGAGPSGAIWRDYMVAAHQGLPVKPFGKPAHLGSKPGNA